MTGRKIHWVCVLGAALLGSQLGGCPLDGGATDETLRVSFDAGGGNFAVATDKQGNQYTFRAREEANGETTITEANILTADGRTLKLSLDSSGRPVNARLSNNTAADLVYDGDEVTVRVTDAQGGVTGAAAGLKTDTRKEEVRARRVANFSKAALHAQGMSTKLTALQKGLEVCEEVIVSITDPETNPDCPLIDSDLETGIGLIANIASLVGIVEVDARTDLGDIVVIDVIPEAIQQLAGKTFKLFDAEGFCLELTDVINRLTFDNSGVLQTEFDRHLVFPDFSLSGGQDAGITINYLSGTPVNLTPDGEVGFELWVTPVFTGTQLDDAGHITIERRFLADLTFDVNLFAGGAVAEAHQLFDVAFINGELSEDGTLLELDLILVDLSQANPVATLGRLRYHDQNVRQPTRIFACSYDPQSQFDLDPERGIICPPGIVPLGEDIDIAFDPGSADEGDFIYDWFISSGSGYIIGDPTAPVTTFRATAAGFLEITLLVHDMWDDPDVLGVYTCTVNVGQDGSSGVPGADELAGFCPVTMVVDEPEECWVQGPLVSQLVYLEWFVIGTWNYFIDNPFAPRTGITFFEPGSFQVVFQAWTADGEYIYLYQDVDVVAEGEVDWGDDGPYVGDYSDYVGDYVGELTDPEGWAHTFEFTVFEDGTVEGASYWGAGQFALLGWVDEFGDIYFEDDADTLGYALGIYVGEWDDGYFVGSYFEDSLDNYIGDWFAEW